MENVNPVTESVKEIKTYLKSFGSNGISEKVLESGVMKVLQKSTREEKAFLHMALFFHVGGLDSVLMDDVQNDPDDFLGLLPPMDYPGLPLELYCRLVMEGGLMQHFFQMLVALPQKYNVGAAVTQMVDRMLEGVAEYCDSYVFVLLVLVKCSRPTGVEGTILHDIYHECLKKLVKKYVEDEGIFSRKEQLAILLKLGGVACMMKEEYQTSSNELGELLEEYDFDMSHRVAIDTQTYFEKLLRKSEAVRGINPKTLEFLSETLKQLNCSDEEAESFKVKKTLKVTWLDYIGVTAFFTKSVLEKRITDKHVEDKIETMLNQSALWSKYRPKIKVDDYKKDIGDFNEFYKVIRKFGQKEQVRTDLLHQFLTFPYSDIFLKKDGLKITERYLIPGATYDIAVEYIKKSMDFDAMPSGLLGIIPEMVKLAVFKMICCNQNVRKRREDLVSEIFRNGSHSHFSRNSFTIDIVQACSKLGLIEKETDSKQIDHNRDIIFNVCFQNPSSALESLLSQAMKSRKFKAVELARPFFTVVPSVNPDSGNCLIEYCFKKLLDAADEADPMIGSIEASIPSLLDHQILNGDQVFRLLKSSVSELLSGHELDLGKVGKCFQLMESVAKSLESNYLNKYSQEESNGTVDLPRQVLREIGAYAVQMATVTCAMMDKKIYKPLMSIKRSCYTIIRVAKVDLIEEDTLDADNLYTLESLGLLYIRGPKLRSQILSRIEQIDPKSLSYEEGIERVASLFLNSEPTFEWESCIEFLLRVFFPKFLGEWGEKNSMDLINHCTYVVFEFSVLSDDHVFIRQWLKFYKQFVSKIWTKKQRITDDCQLSILKALVTLSMCIRKVSEMKEKTRVVRSTIQNTMQQLLLLVLDMVNLIVMRHSVLDSEFKDKILNIITLLPNDDKIYSNIYRCITERVLKEKNTKMLPLPNDDGGNEDGDVDQ